MSETTSEPAGPRPRLITGRTFARALEAAGIVHDLNRIERIVIVADDAAEPVRVHVQRFGDERILDVAAILAGKDGP